MKYLKIKPEYDNYVINQNFDILVGNELLTINEFNKLNIPSKIKYKCADLVEVNKSDTYWFFGARFCNDEDIRFSYTIDETDDLDFMSNQLTL